MHGGGDARGNRQFAGNADDQYALTGENPCLSLFWLFGSAGRHEGGFQQLLCIRMLRRREYLGSRPVPPRPA